MKRSTCAPSSKTLPDRTPARSRPVPRHRVLPASVSPNEPRATFNSSEYVVPVFGQRADLGRERLVTQVSLYMNSVFFFKEQVDMDQIRQLRWRYRDEIEQIEALLGISIPRARPRRI